MIFREVSSSYSRPRPPLNHARGYTWIKYISCTFSPFRVKDTGKEGQEQQESFNGEAMFLFPAACVLLYIVERITIDSSRFLIRTILELGRSRRGKREFFEL